VYHSTLGLRVLKRETERVVPGGFHEFVVGACLELSDTKVYAPEIQARLGTAAHFSDAEVGSYPAAFMSL